MQLEMPRDSLARAGEASNAPPLPTQLSATPTPMLAGNVLPGCSVLVFDWY